MTRTKATSQQPQLQVFVFHICQPPYLCGFALYTILSNSYGLPFGVMHCCDILLRASFSNQIKEIVSMHTK